jgi:septum formation protein
MNLTLLASSSPRRQTMLRQWIPLLQVGSVPLFVETIPPRGNVKDIAQNLAYQKLQAVLSQFIPHNIRYIITADTLVAHDEQILGKPSSTKEARQMLLRHLGHTHLVVSAAWVYDRQNGAEHGLLETATVQFRPHSDKVEQVIDAYLTQQPPHGPLDKAGAYGIQEPLVRDNLIERIEGSYEAIVGFPLQSFQALWHVMIPSGGA